MQRASSLQVIRVPAMHSIGGKLRILAALCDDLDRWEYQNEAQIESDTPVRETEKEALIRARRGQGLFKERVSSIESHCRITSVGHPVHLVASHCKPCARFDQRGTLGRRERTAVDAKHGHLFDRGFIGFEDPGLLILSPVAHKPSQARMGVETERVVNVGVFRSGQRKFWSSIATACYSAP